MYIRLQFCPPGLPDIKDILQKYMPQLHQSVTIKTVIPDLPIISFSQHPKSGDSWAKLHQPPSVNYEAPGPSQSCGKSHCKCCLSFIFSNYITSTSNNKTLKCNNENTSCDSNVINVFCNISRLQYVGQSNNFRTRMN